MKSKETIQKRPIEPITSFKSTDVAGSYIVDILCKEKPEVGFQHPFGNPSAEIVEIHDYKNPTEWGARPMNEDAAPTCPPIPAGKELSYAKVQGRDALTAKEEKEKFFLTKEQHIERMNFVKGDPKQERKHGWHWARVTMKNL